MLFPRRFGLSCALACCAVLFNPLTAPADTAVLHPVADTSLIQVAPDANLGGAEFFNAGTAGNGNRNRGLLLFALSESIPAGSIIESVSLSLDVVRNPSVDIQPATFGLHRVFAAWGEGNKVPAEESSPGLGAPATDGEATWVYRFLNQAAWTVPGGKAGTDFDAQAGSTTFVYGVGDEVLFENTGRLIADVQAWVDHPDTNFGWMVMTEDELVRKSARSFASHEDPSGGPTLVIGFTVVPEPMTWTLGLMGLAGLSLNRMSSSRAASHRVRDQTRQTRHGSKPRARS